MFIVFSILQFYVLMAIILIALNRFVNKQASLLFSILASDLPPSCSNHDHACFHPWIVSRQNDPRSLVKSIGYGHPLRKEMEFKVEDRLKYYKIDSTSKIIQSKIPLL